MYRSHLLESVEAADRMREVQARLQREMTLEAEKVHGRMRAPVGLMTLIVRLRAIPGLVARPATNPPDK